MADIEVVIKIPEEIRLALINNIQLSIDQQSICDSCIKQAIINGTPIPKGHGDLIDRDDLLADSYYIDDWSGNEVDIVDVMTVKMVDAIIEADKEEDK